MFNIELQAPVVAYLRVSSDKQREAHTIEGQMFALTAFCDRAGIQLAGIYKDDGVNGDLPYFQRPDGTRLIADAKEGRFKTVLLYLYDRFSRDVYEGIAAANALVASGAKPFSINEPFDISTPYGQHQFVASLNNAQLIKAQTLERMREGMRRRARAGAYMGSESTPPYGYRIEREKMGRRSVSVLTISQVPVPGIDKTESQIMRWVFEHVAGGGTSHEIGSELYRLGAPPPAGRFRSDYKVTVHSWSNALSRALHNPIYRGVHVFNKGRENSFEVPVPHLAIVDDETWHKANAQTAKNRQLSSKNRNRLYLLRGLVVCGQCGRIYSGCTMKGYHDQADATYNAVGTRYRCSGRTETTGSCNGKSVSGAIEMEVWNVIAGWLQTPHNITRIIQRASVDRQNEVAPLNARLGRLEKAAASVGESRERIIAAMGRGIITLDEADKQLAGLKSDHDTLQADIADIQNKIRAAQAGVNIALETEALLRREAESIGEDMPPWETRRALVERLVEKIVVTTTEKRGKRDACVTVTFRFGSPDAPLHWEKRL